MRNKKLILGQLVKLSLLLVALKGISQEITGSVYHNGTPIPNVSILIKDTFNGTKTDKDGKFSIKAKVGDILVLSHLGIHTKEVKIEDLNAIKINVKTKINPLKEVEVKSSKKTLSKPKSIQSMFGEIEMDNVGYTAYSFSGEELRRYSAIGIAEALIGRVPNYQLTNQGVTLRGRRSNGENQEQAQSSTALWDIDGMLFYGLSPFLDIETVESVFVIPSVAGSVLYGKRASGGVIIVNTNRFKFKNNPKTQLKQLNHIVLDDYVLPIDSIEFLDNVKKTAKDLEKLRLMAMAYQKKGCSEVALRLHRMLFSYRPNDIKSYRDVAASLLNNNYIEEAWNTYLVYLDTYGENLDQTSLGIIFNDMERLYHAFDLQKTIGKRFDTKQNPKNVTGQARVVFEWTAPNETLAVELINPNNQAVRFQLGNTSTKESAVEELFLDGRIKGIWKLNLSVVEDIEQLGSLRVTVYQNWLSSKALPKSKVFSLFWSSEEQIQIDGNQVAVTKRK